MTHFVYRQDRIVSEWVSERIVGDYTADHFDGCVTIGLADDRELIAGCIYSNFRRGSMDIEMTFASSTPKWATRGNLREFFLYPFDQLKCQRVTAIVDERNWEAQLFIKRLGFIHEGVMRRAMDGKHNAYIYGMLKEECKWLKPKKGAKVNG